MSIFAFAVEEPSGQSSTQFGLLLVTDVADGRLVGQLVGEEPRSEWDTYRIDVSHPSRQDSRVPKPTESQVAAARAAFDRLVQERPIGSLVAIPDLHGFFDFQRQVVCGGGFEFQVVFKPEEAEEALARFDVEIAKSEWTGESLSEARQRLLERVPGIDLTQKGLWSLIGGDIVEYHAEQDIAASQPDEALVYCAGGKENAGILIATHGGYLMYTRERNGDRLDGAGFDDLPAERGLYYVKGDSWATTPDTGLDYDSGIRVTEAVLATDEHLAIFGISREDVDEAIAEYNVEYGADEPVSAPSP